MSYRDNLDNALVVEDPIDDSVLTAAGRAERRKRLSQGPSDALRILLEGTDNELEGGVCDPFGQIVLKGTSTLAVKTTSYPSVTPDACHLPTSPLGPRRPRTHRRPGIR
jgi:hypothetical protein